MLKQAYDWGRLRFISNEIHPKLGIRKSKLRNSSKLIASYPPMISRVVVLNVSPVKSRTHSVVALNDQESHALYSW